MLASAWGKHIARLRHSGVDPQCGKLSQCGHNDATVSTPQLSFPRIAQTFLCFCPGPLRRPCVICQWLLPLQRTRSGGHCRCEHGCCNCQTPRPPSKHWQGKLTTARPFNQLMKGSEHCWVSPLIAIVRSTARKITGRMFDEGGAHRSSLTADRQVKSFHAFQDPAE